MLADISILFSRIGADSPEPMEHEQFEFDRIECGRDEEIAFIVYEGDPEVYDSGKVLTVVYGRNENEPDALENRILDCDEDKENAIADALDDIIPNISFFYPTVTRIALKTVNGILTTVITKDVDEIVSYLPTPSHLSHISTVPINELRIVTSLDFDVDRVKWKNEAFAFKKTGEDVAGTIRELTILDRLCNSPNIIDIKAIVVNQDNIIRGFLMPYMHAGNLEDVFFKVHPDAGVLNVDDKPAIDWSIKLTWARQVAQGVVDLHAIAAYNGDLKLQNIVLGPTGQAVLIDFLSIGFSHAIAAPEVLAKHIDPTLELMLKWPIGHIFAWPHSVRIGRGKGECRTCSSMARWERTRLVQRYRAKVSPPGSSIQAVCCGSVISFAI